ncbi:serine/threonine-protein kinase LATS1-like [Acipenser ruthenus]|uniref:serine/threonine-protein kinase LATS1-like n=1 Tax=Acipenser ruthenus TaxID=7906 RepID=UPI00145B223B|nr:serine/threonine-protein kinase LATS1-like [Acipenser ruthenus]XP_058881134.1 serine/threonine-protein kinase LATS1-like [Acipenser ruthenus]XP_058881135.1 serine/threonine-protein kinase LATS1-like [Acipenser ruthenus]
MKRGEKPEGYRQMRPKTFPASNYTGNSRQMLQEIRESLRNLSRPSESAKTEQGSGKGVTEDPRQQGRNSNPKFVTYHKALQEIRNSLLPFANETSSSGRGGSEVNRQMLQDLQAAGFEEEMVIRALKQTNCRSLEAAIEYISKMSYQDPWREQMVAAAARPVNAGMKAPGSCHVQQPINRKQSWKGSKESLVQRHGPPLMEGVMYRSDSPGPPSEMGVRPLSGSGLTAFSQVHQGNGQRVNPPPPPQVRSITPPPPPPRGTTPPPTSWDTNPSTKRFSGNMEYLVPRISPGPQGAWSESYPAPPPPGQRGISSVPLGRQPIIMQSSGGTKFSFPPGWSQNGTGQPDFLGPPPPYPMSQGSRQSPPASQMQAGGPVSSPTYANGSNLPQSMMVSNRNSHNLDLYNIAGIPSSWPQPPPPSQPQSSPGNSGHATSWQHKLPVRSNSFTNPQLSGRPSHPASSQPSATTVTAITQAPILQPVKSMRVQKPELQTAVAPTHPPWMQQPPPPSGSYQESPPSLGSSPVVAEVPSYQGPPPPYPKHLLQQPNQPYDSSAKSGSSKEDQVGGAGRKEQEEESSSGSSNERAEVTEGAIVVSAGSADKEKKQITTSPVPVRRNKKDESRIQIYSPQAFKFFMEQHVENILKNHQQRLRRKKQLESEMQRVGLSEDAQEQMRMMLCQKESNYIRLKRAKMDKCMFVKIKTLGIGAFGEVCLAKKVDTNALYAMKTLRKKDVLLRNQVAHVKAERDILAEADNEWVVRLYYSFQDKDNLYFVMDYIPGGDMMSLLIRMSIFPEELAQFYIAELTCAVESVHKMGFIHRDIKPDNILIDRDGHIKLTDFGLCTGFRWTHDSKYYQSGDHVRQDSMDFSKEWEDPTNCRCGDRLKPLERRAARQHQRCLAHSLVGTPNYIAPEVLLRTGYTQLCDWWSVGVILYEMLVGQPPFLASAPLETQLKVINWQTSLHIPPQAKLSPEASDLIIKLCRGPEDRLGKNGADEIKVQPFFKTIDFSTDLRQQERPAPYIPKITHSTDTSNFDPVDPDKLWSSGDDGEGNLNDTLNGWYKKGKHPEHAFYEFTFRRFFDDNGHPYSYPKPIEYDGYDPEDPDSEQHGREDGSSQTGQSRDLVYV